MKIPYTFVLLSSCVMISSAMAMIEPSDVEAATTSTTTLPLAHAPVADTATGTDKPDAQLNTTPPAFDPRAIADDDANDASRQATVEDADEDSATGSYESSSDNDDDTGDKAAPAASATSTSDTSASTTTLPTLTFTKVSPEVSVDGAYKITERGSSDDRFFRVEKKPSQLFNLTLERQLLGEYWHGLKTTVDAFVQTNTDDKASFFIRPMTTLQTRMKDVDGDMKHLLTCGDRIFDDGSVSSLKNVGQVVMGLKGFLRKADYYVWMGRRTKSDTVYPWMKNYDDSLGIKNEDIDQGDNNIFRHLDKMTVLDQELHGKLAFIHFAGNIVEGWVDAMNASLKMAKSVAIAGENKWEKPQDPKSQLMEMLMNPMLMRAMMGSRAMGPAGPMHPMAALLAALGDNDNEGMSANRGSGNSRTADANDDNETSPRGGNDDGETSDQDNAGTSGQTGGGNSSDTSTQRRGGSESVQCAQQ